MNKVLMTASTYSHIRNFHLPYLREFQRLGWETHVGCKDISADAPYIDKAIDLPFEKKMQSPENFRAAHMLRYLIQTEQYDLIITHTSLAAFFTRLAARGTNGRLVNVVHGYLFDDDTPLLKRAILLAAERLTAPRTDLLLTMNAWDYKTAVKYRLGRQIAMVPGMGIDASRLDAASPEDSVCLRRELGISSDAFVLLYPAEFSKRKSQHVLIKAMQYLPESVWLILCGAGDQLSACRALARKLHVQDRVHFPGQVTDIAIWYRMADALVASSRSEGLPFNVMEAMYCGLPVVASAVKGHTDLVEDGVTGLLYPYGDAEKCADGVRRLLEAPQTYYAIAANVSAFAADYALGVVMPKIMKSCLSTVED